MKPISGKIGVISGVFELGTYSPVDKNSLDRNHQTCYHFEQKIPLVQKIAPALTLNLLEDVVCFVLPVRR